MWSCAVVSSKGLLGDEDTRDSVVQEVMRTVEYTKGFLAEVKECLTTGTSAVEAKRMLEKVCTNTYVFTHNVTCVGRLK